MIGLKLPWPPSPRALRWAGGAAAAVVSIPALALVTGASALIILGGAVTVGSLAVAALSLRRAAGLRRQGKKLSNDLDALSLRLIVLEGRMARGSAPPRAEPSRAGEEVTAEIGLLGEIVRDLAVAVAAHDREVAALKQDRGKTETGPSERSAAARPTPPPRPTLVVPAAPSASAADAAKASAKAAPLVWPPRPSTATVAPKAEPEPASLERAAAILSAFDGDRLELHLQPIVSLPQRHVRLYEALARLRLADETLLVPAEFLPVLERQDSMPDLDRKVLARSAAIARHLESRGSDALICCNLAAQSLEEPGFLRAVSRLVEAHPDLASRLVLELSQRSWRTLDAEKAGALAALRDRGLGFSLDGASDLRLDPLSLADRGVRFLKLPGAMLLGPESGRSVDVAMSDLSATLARAGIRLVAERIEREEDIPDLIDLDVPLAQGFVFGRPRAVRAEVVTGASAPAAVPQPAPSPARPAPEEKKEPAPPQRLPFRSFLRRAS